MANYFNSLDFRIQRDQLSRCRFMQRDEFENGCDALKGKSIVIVGCGAQGLNQGLNMRDSGLNISYALRQAAIDEKRDSFQRTGSKPKFSYHQFYFIRCHLLVHCHHSTISFRVY